MSRVRSPSPASKINRKAQRLPVVLFRASGLLSARNAQARRRRSSAWPRRQRRTDLDRERLRTTPNDTVLCGFVRTTGKVNAEGRAPGRPKDAALGHRRSPHLAVVVCQEPTVACPSGDSADPGSKTRRTAPSMKVGVSSLIGEASATCSLWRSHDAHSRRVPSAPKLCSPRRADPAPFGDMSASKLLNDSNR